MMAVDPSAARSQFFKELKPRCVAINNLAVRSSDKRASAKDLTKVTEDLSLLLQRQVSVDASVLDGKLADYIYFPLSNILRNQQHYPSRLTELTIRCFTVLVDYGWKTNLPKELAQQLILLLTLIIGGTPGQTRENSIPEETELESFRALTSVVKSQGSSPSGAAALVDAKTIPALGHAITIVLDGVTAGRTFSIQLEALQSLDALVAAIKDPTALASFLPGIVSSLSRLLTPPSALNVHGNVLIRGIGTLKNILTKVLGDIKIRALLNTSADEATAQEAQNKILSPSWLKATTDKVKVALGGVIKLRNHRSDDVRSALESLCISLLDESHQSLAESAPILVETAVVLTNYSESESRLSAETSLADLATLYPELGDVIKNTVYNWVTSLPRVVQGSEEQTKQQAMRNLIQGHHFITTLQIDSYVLEDSLASSFRDTATALVLASKPATAVTEILPDAADLNTTGLTKQGDSAFFRPVLVNQENERSTREAFLELVTSTGTATQQIRTASDMLAYVRESTGVQQVASYWLAFELIRSALTRSSDMDEFLDFTLAAPALDGSESALHELYSLSVVMLDSQAEAEDIDPRMQALALEVATFVASRMQEAFRSELIDVLYPVATFLGSDVPQLREHAIVSLNSIAASCAYSSVTELIIDNVDYMVNSVSLRLNTFDISPASTQVLRMMIQLTGPRLLPYLDDVVASIFAALDNYHGYTVFVESLFAVLSDVVQQGTQSSKLLREDVQPFMGHEKRVAGPMTTQQLSGIIDNRRERAQKQEHEEQKYEELKESSQTPFIDERNQIVGDGMDEDEPTGEIEKPPLPQTPTFQLLSRITNLTQHYLTSPTPTLRRSLLKLLANVFPALATDVDAFLPLVNDVWPVLVERLYDRETFVATAACEALSALCSAAGDFLSTRIKTEWWDNGLGKWCRKIKAEALRQQGQSKGNRSSSTKIGAPMFHHELNEDKIFIPIRGVDGRLEHKQQRNEVSAPADSGLGRFAQAAQVWVAVQSLLVAIISHVQVDDDILDQILILLVDGFDSMPTAKAALEVIDPDAVWLLLYERGMLSTQLKPLPTMRGMDFIRI
ncbi:ARM repeat-containing protein [Xylariaceae sp. FL1019]|nr:ARM repeat-containing protein [Xylariaceae sp. FL1019]